MSSDVSVHDTLSFSERQSSLGEVINTICVNFLLYVVLIIVFYMLVRFYLEEETTTSTPQDAFGGNDTEVEMLSSESGSGGVAASSVDDEKMLPHGCSSKSLQSDSKSFLNVSQWGEPEGTKDEVIQRAVFCAMGLHISFCIWGLLQERMLTHSYDGEFFVYSYGLVLMNRLGGLLLSGYLMYHFQVRWVTSPLWEFSFPSVANMLSSWCQYEALKYVSFPTQMLAKSFKIVPIMLMGKFMNDKNYESYEYMCAATIGFGIYLFISSSENLDLGQNSFGNPEGVTGSWCGIVLLIFFLFFDSFTGQWQSRMFEMYKSMSSLQMMLITNAFSVVFAFVTLVHQEELSRPFEFVYRHPDFALHLTGFCITSTVGQLFIFYTVQKFGAVVFAIIMAVRILLSVILSCIVYSHPITELGYIGMILVFGATGFRLKKKSEGSPLIRWRETESAKEVFKEWHEHLDI